MAATIKIKNSSTANAKPTSSDLVQGELAINVTDKKIFTEDSGGNVVELGANFNGFKNRIINGAMVIDQRNAGASVTPTNATYTVDRWAAVLTQASKFTVQQNAGSVTPPAGFKNYMGVTSSSAYSVGSGDAFGMYQWVEGFNCADLAWGTSSAATVTLSFWVRSSLTGTFGGSIINNATDRSYVFSYTISAANTWEQKSITIAGDQSGTWLTTNGAGIMVRYGLGSGSTFTGTAGSWGAGNIVQPTGSVSVVGTNGATFYITGVQLEKGSTATSFDYRPYGTELALCQRYLPAWFGTSTNAYGGGFCYSSTNAVINLFYPVTPRVAPSGATTTGNFYLLNSGGAGVAVTALVINSSTLASAQFAGTVASGLVAGNGTNLLSNGVSAIYATGCEL